LPAPPLRHYESCVRQHLLEWARGRYRLHRSHVRVSQSARLGTDFESRDQRRRRWEDRCRIVATMEWRRRHHRNKRHGQYLYRCAASLFVGVADASGNTDSLFSRGRSRSTNSIMMRASRIRVREAAGEVLLRATETSVLSMRSLVLILSQKLEPPQCAGQATIL
jgi:hypothetical protein